MGEGLNQGDWSCRSLFAGCHRARYNDTTKHDPARSALPDASSILATLPPSAETTVLRGAVLLLMRQGRTGPSGVTLRFPRDDPEHPVNFHADPQTKIITIPLSSLRFLRDMSAAYIWLNTRNENLQPFHILAHLEPFPGDPNFARFRATTNHPLSSDRVQAVADYLKAHAQEFGRDPADRARSAQLAVYSAEQLSVVADVLSNEQAQGALRHIGRAAMPSNLRTLGKQ